jgi:hypothetical protein
LCGDGGVVARVNPLGLCCCDSEPQPMRSQGRARDGPTIRRRARMVGSDSACLLYRPTPILMQHAAHGTIPPSCAHFICLPSQQLQQYSILFCSSMNLSVRHSWGSGCISGPTQYRYVVDGWPSLDGPGPVRYRRMRQWSHDSGKLAC